MELVKHIEEGIALEKQQKPKLRWYERAVLIAAYAGLSYMGAGAFRSFVCNGIDETVVPTKAYRFIVTKSDSVFNIFSQDRLRYESVRNFKEGSLENKDCLERVLNGERRILIDLDADGSVDVICQGKKDAETSFVRAMPGDENSRRFKEADELLEKTREEYADFVSEVEAKARFGM